MNRKSFADTSVGPSIRPYAARFLLVLPALLKLNQIQRIVVYELSLRLPKRNTTKTLIEKCQEYIKNVGGELFDKKLNFDFDAKKSSSFKNLHISLGSDRSSPTP